MSDVRLLLNSVKTRMNRTRLILVVSFVLVTVLIAGLGSPQSQATAACGHPSNGVQMCLTSSGSDLELAFRNIGNRDVTLNLGVMMSNGKVQLPDRIAIRFTDAQGKTRLFKFGDKRYPGVAGRLDDYVVPLRVGSMYTLQLTLDQFWCEETKEFSIPLSAGDNYLTAQFEGTGANVVNSDVPSIKFMNFWLGNVESNILTMRR
jgi:hypothetical protein